MKKSMNAWTVDSTVGFEEMFRQVRDAGFAGIELNVDSENHSAHSLTMKTTERELAGIRAASDACGLQIVSISSSLYAGKMGSPDASDRAFAKALIEKQLACAKALGADGILCVPGGACPRISLKQDYETSLETLKSMKSAIEQTGLTVDVENVWNGFFTSPFDMARFVDEIDSPSIGAYYDVGNTVAFSFTEHWIDVLGPRIHHVHVKDFKRNGGINSGGSFVDLLEGSVDWQAVMPALRKAGFDGYITAEVFKPDSIEGYTEYYQNVSDALDNILKF